jgi:hypothetical protein
MPNVIAGIDNVTPIYQPNARWTSWNLNEIYFGQQGQNKYIPNVNDFVVNVDTGEIWKVESLDPVTYVPTLVRMQIIETGTLSDVLLGVGPGTESDTYRVYIDKSVVPYTLAVDARLKVAGSMVSKAMLFRGSQLDGSAVVISALYDQSGTLLGQAIPLELVAMENNTNIAIKTVPVCNTMADIPDGEIITAVFYSDAGKVVSKRQLLAENTAFIRNTDTSVKYITSISLESPFLSQADPTLIQYPLNVPLTGLDLIGVVNYSDGSKSRLPVDGTKFTVFGFDGFISTIVGQKFNVVLKYSLSQGEVIYGANAVNGEFITKTYKATTTKAEGSYTVKLFGYPEWSNAINGYHMEWFLCNLDRSVIYRVTPYVVYNANSPAFVPTAYGIVQHLSVSINLQDVNGSFKAYRYVQTMDVTLLGPASARTTNWTIGFAPNQTPQYGLNNYASTTFINQNYWEVYVNSGATSQDEWLQRIYYDTLPLFDTSNEVAPIKPNYFALVFGNESIEYPISEWNNKLTISNAVPDNTNLYIKFMFKTPDNELQLSISALPIYQTN